MRNTRFVVGCGLAAILVTALGGRTPSSAQTAVAIGDIVQTGVNGQNVVGEVIRVRGNTADLNLGQNNVSQLVAFEYLKLLQKAGAGAKSTCAIGDTVQVPYVANTVMTGRLMKTNGDYCEFDSSGSGFTGWAKCSEIRRASGGTCAPAIAAAGRAGAAGAATPPRPGLVSCAGKFEGRYAPSSGLVGLTIVFRSGKATLSGPLMDTETFDCWTGGGKIILHKQGEEDLPIEINDDGTLDTPLGELKKKAG
jgi:hypothetical protein